MAYHYGGIIYMYPNIQSSRMVFNDVHYAPYSGYLGNQKTTENEENVLITRFKRIHQDP